MSEPGTIDAPGPPWSPWQLLYGGAHRLRRAWWRRRARRLERPVISVGNLHWGGAGKTPLVAAVAAHLRDGGARVAILSRGYGRRDRRVRIVSTGDGQPLLGPSVAGDEPVLLAGELPGVAVVVGPDRYLAGMQALERLGPWPDLFLLDDGFSHLRLARDLDLLVFPAADPFAGDRLAPAGRLREPLAAARAADAVLLSGASVGARGDDLARALRPFGFAGPGFACPIVAGPVRGVATSEPRPGARVVAAAAVARPEPFFAELRRQGFEVAEALRFPDHHRYPEATLERLRDAVRRHEASHLVVTVKDRVKLLGRLDVPLAELPIRAVPEPGFFDWLDARIADRRLLPARPDAGRGGG